LGCFSIDGGRTVADRIQRVCWKSDCRRFEMSAVNFIARYREAFPDARSTVEDQVAEAARS
jgi:hypothetical protein